MESPSASSAITGTESAAATTTVAATPTPTPTPLPPSTSSSTPLILKADFSITVQSESTTKLNATFDKLMETVHATTGLSFRGPLRLPKDGKIHSRRIDLKSITESQLRIVATQSGIELAQDAGVERIQANGVIVSFDIE